MTSLALTMRPIEGETAFSLTSRLSVRNGVGFSEFLRDMGLSLPAVLDGTDAMVHRLADLAGIDATELRRNTPRLEGGGRTSLRGHIFPTSALRSTTIRGCRDCLAEDLRQGQSEGAAIRGVWLLSHVTICRRHARPLEPLWTEAQPIRRYDSAARVLEIDASSWTCGATLEKRNPSDGEIWLQDRLEGKLREPIWLDRFSLNAASLFCAELGRAAIATKLPKWKKLGTEDLWWPSAVGFDLCKGGEAGLLEALAQLQQMMGRPEDGPKKVFGNLHELLAADPLPEDLLPFRELLRSHIATTWPLGPGDELLGEPVLKRRLHSVLTASRLTGRTAGEIRDALTTAGAIPHSQMEVPDAWAVFEAREAAALLEQLAANLPDDKFCQILGLTDELLDAFHAAKNENGSWNPVQAQALLDDLLRGAETVYVAMHDWTDVPTAARQLNCRQSEIVEMIRDGRLPRIGRNVQRHGFASMLVDLASMANDENLISAELFAVSQGIPRNEMLRFLNRETTPSRIAAAPRGRGARRVLTSDDVAAFHRDFISYRKMAIGADLSWEELDAFLSGNAISPVPGFKRIYRRSDVSELISVA